MTPCKVYYDILLICHDQPLILNVENTHETNRLINLYSFIASACYVAEFITEQATGNSWKMPEK